MSNIVITFSVHSRISSSAHLNEVGTYTHVRGTLRSYVISNSCKRQSCDIELSWMIVQDGVDEAFLLMLCLWLVERWSVLQSCLIILLPLRKGFLEGTVLPPVKIYLDPAGSPVKARMKRYMSVNYFEFLIFTVEIFYYKKSASHSGRCQH